MCTGGQKITLLIFQLFVISKGKKIYKMSKEIQTALNWSAGSSRGLFIREKYLFL